MTMPRRDHTSDNTVLKQRLTDLFCKRQVVFWPLWVIRVLSLNSAIVSTEKVPGNEHSCVPVKLYL